MDNIGLKPNAKIVGKGEKELAYWVCISADSSKKDAYYIEEFKKYKSQGLHIILVENGKDSVFVEHLVVLAETEGVEVHTAFNVPNMNPDTLNEAIEQAKKNGAEKAIFFDQAALSKK